MQFEYIDKNLNEIIQNPDSVMYIRPYDIGNNRALFAIIKEEQGVYKKVQITKEQHKLTFPLDPMFWFYHGPGYFYLKKFIVLNNWIALNTTNLDGFKYKILNEAKIFNTGIYATFNDGTATFIIREKRRKFEKQGGIESYINLLKQYKEYEPQHDTYKSIEYYSNDSNDTIIIPELQQKIEELPKVKKLTKDNNKQD